MNRLHFVYFLLIVSLVYFFVHYYVYVRIADGLALSALYRNYLKIFFVIAGLSFFVDRFIGRMLLPDPLAFSLSYFGVLWVGIISIAFSIFLIQFLVVLILPNRTTIITYMAIIMVMLVSCFSVYIGSRVPRLKRMEIPIEKLPSEFEGFSIIQLSDLHLHRWISEAWLQSVVEKTNALDPDLVVITGDLIEESIHRCSKFIGILKQIQSRYGVLAITGNHEFYTGIKNFAAFAQKANIRVLRNESITVANAIEIIGIDDKAGRGFQEKGPDLKSALEVCDFNRPVILLSHRPENFREAANMGVDLQLSGHTHAGQIPPMDLIVFLTYKYPYGLYGHNSSFIYTTSGTGIWGPPMRLFSRSEIVKFVLTKKRPLS